MGKLAIEGGVPVRAKEKFLVFGAPLIEEPEIEEVVGCMRRRWIGTGPKAHQFERDFAEYKGSKHAIALNSCTAAIHLAMFAAGIAPGDEVITTPYTFFATAGSIARTGAKPVFVDIQKDTYNIDPNLIERKISAKTRAIIPVHLYGQCRYGSYS